MKIRIFHSTGWLLAGLCALAVAPIAAQSADLAAGKALYESTCIACHGTGAAGAPTLGDKAAWDPYFKNGLQKMLEIAIKGQAGMPARGGSDASDEQIRDAIEYIMSETR